MTTDRSRLTALPGAQASGVVTSVGADHVDQVPDELPQRTAYASVVPGAWPTSHVVGSPLYGVGGRAAYPPSTVSVASSYVEHPMPLPHQTFTVSGKRA